MKPKFLVKFLIIFFVITSHLAAQEPAFVQVRESKIRTQPKIWSPAVTSVSYGDALTILSENAGWAKVKSNSGKTGFLPLSAITSKKVVFASRTVPQSLSTDPTDAILAGKGFDKEVERMYASQSSGDYGAVDKLERIKISDGELRSFVSSGSLKGGE